MRYRNYQWNLRNAWVFFLQGALIPGAIAMLLVVLMDLRAAWPLIGGV